MRSQSFPHVAGNAWFCRLFAPAGAAIVLGLAPASLPAQQDWPQNPQYGYGQYSQQPYAQQPYPDQQSYSVPGPYSGQSYAQPVYAGGQASFQPLTADQLEQLVAPIALYPDTLLAQILTAATYPAQVAGADRWRQAQNYASPDGIAAAADAEPWDPSVKALTAFPQVLAMMDRDLEWTTNLGNAYYNQPQDVLQTVQVLRQRAEDAGTLRSTPQQAVVYEQGYIQLAPANPQVIYVPAYNPWDVYGQPIQPYSGFSLLGSLQSIAGSSAIGYGLGMAMSAFTRTSFNPMSWALNWLTQSVLFNHSNYTSRSTTVARWNVQRPERALPTRPMPMGGYNRGQLSYSHPANGWNGAPAQGLARPPAAGYVRSAPQNYAYNRPPLAAPVPARPQTYARPGDYAQRNYSGQRAYPATAYAASRERSFVESQGKQERSGEPHLFGGHKEERSYARVRAPKSFRAEKAPREHSHGGGHAHGGHSGGHRL